MTTRNFNDVSPRKKPEAPPEVLHGYHIHIYFEAGKDSEKNAKKVLADIEEKFPGKLKNIHRVGIVGPHLQPNFGSYLPPDDFGKVVGWLQRHSEGLSILVHPITDDELKDHRDNALWLGKPVPLDISFFEPPQPAAPKGPTLQ